MKSLLATMLIGSAMLTVATEAVAAGPFTSDALEIRKTISLRDLDLSEPSDLPIAYARVQQGASAVCAAAVRAERRMLRRIPAGWRDQCVQQAVDEAVRGAQDQRLTALHSRNTELIADER